MSSFYKILFAASLWGFAGPFIKWINLQPTSTVFFRFSIPLLAILIQSFITQRRIKFRADKTLLFASFTDSIRMFTFLLGFTYTSIGNAVIVFYTWPIFVMIFSSFILKEKINQLKLLMISLSFVGILIIFSQKSISYSTSDLLGMLAVLISAILNAFCIVIYKTKSTEYDRTDIIFYQNFMGAFLFLPFIFINRPFPSMEQTFLGIGYGFLIGYFCYLFFFPALKEMNASIASILAYVEVVSAVIIGILFFNESLSLQTLIGGLLIISSVIIIKLNEYREGITLTKILSYWPFKVK